MKQTGRGCRETLLVLLLLLFWGGISLGWGGFERLSPVLGKVPEQTGDGEIACERGGEILLLTADGRQRRLYGDGDAALGPWSSDGKRLVLLTGLFNDGERRRGKPLLLDQTGVKIPMAPGGDELLPGEGEIAWTGAGKIVMTAAASEALYLGSPAADGTLRARPWFVPSGKKTMVWHPRQIPGSDEMSCWLTEGDGVNVQVEARLVLLTPQGGLRRTIFRTMIWPGSDPPVDVLWSPDGKSGLVYTDSIAGLNWFLVDRKGNFRRVLSPEASDPCWLNSDQLLYRERSTNRFLVLDLSRESSRPFLLPSWVEWVQVSPDGRRLLLARASAINGRWDLYTAQPDGSGLNLLITGAGAAEWKPRPK